MGQLTFDSAKAVFDGERDIVRFWAAMGNERVLCAVSHEALTDYTRQSNVTGEELVQLYRIHAAKIHDIAQRKYRARVTEVDGLILVKSADLA